MNSYQARGAYTRLRSIVAFALGATALEAQCQTMFSSWGGGGTDLVWQAKVDPATGIIYCGGETDSTGANIDLLLVRLDSNGNHLSTTSWGNSLNDWGNIDLHLGTTTSVFAAGGTDSFSGNGLEDMLIAKFDQNGAFQWAATWSTVDHEYADGMAVSPAGDVYLAGGHGPANGPRDALVVKFPASMDCGTTPLPTVTATAWDTGGDDSFNACAWDPASGSLITVGNTQDTGFDLDLLVQKYDANLNLQWTSTWGNPGSKQDAEGVTVDSAGNIYIVGAVDPAGDEDALLMKWSPTGHLQWWATFDGALNENTWGVSVDVAGNITTSGTTESFGAGFNDGLMLEYGNDGQLLWAQTWGGAQQSEALAQVSHRPGGGFLVPAIGDANHPFALISAPWPHSFSTSTNAVTGPAPGNSLTYQPQNATVACKNGTLGTSWGSPLGFDAMVYGLRGAHTEILPGCGGLLPCGDPALSFDNGPTLGGGFTIRRSMACGPLPALLSVGVPATPIPFSNFAPAVPGAQLCVSPIVSWFTPADHITLNMPLQPAFCGLSFDAQWTVLQTPTLIAASDTGRFVLGF